MMLELSKVVSEYLIQIIPPNPTFENGRNTWRFTNSATNSQLEGSLTTAEHIFSLKVTWIMFRKPLCLTRMLDLRLRSSLKTENSLTHPPQPAQTVIPSKLSTLTHRLRLRLLKLKRSLSKRTNRTRSLKPSLLGRRTVSMSILLMFSSSRLMRQRLLPSKSER